MARKNKQPQDEPDPPADRPEAEAPEGADTPAPADVAAERDDLMARLQRVSADYLNYQKRARRDIAQAREFANDELMRDLLPVLDDMERALEAARANHDEDDPLLKGMQMVHDKALDVLGRLGLSVIEAAGRPFDPELHSAVMQQVSDEQPPRTVLNEVQRGYRLRNRTLRPAAVVVSTGPEEAASEGEPEAGSAEPPDEE